MELTPGTNCWTQTEDSFFNAFPKLASFRQLCKVDDEEAAKKHVMLHSSEAPEEPTGGNTSIDMRLEQGVQAVVVGSPTNPYRLRASKAIGYYNPQGNILIAIENPVTEDDQDHNHDIKAEVYRNFENQIGNILIEFIDYFEINGGPFIREAQVIEYGENEEDDRESEGWLLCAFMVFAWGTPDDN